MCLQGRDQHFVGESQELGVETPIDGNRPFDQCCHFVEYLGFQVCRTTELAGDFQRQLTNPDAPGLEIGEHVALLREEPRI